jgi:NADH:ubiquinone oxidoreductase subunit 3 (subunit A)
LADGAGALAILALALGVVQGLLALHRWLAPRPARSVDAAAGSPARHGLRSGSETRIHVRYLAAALLVLVAVVAVALAVPWAVVARELGMGGVLAFALLLVPGALGILHATSRGPLEW